MTSVPRERALSYRSHERSSKRTPMIPPSPAQFKEDSKEPFRSENALGAQTPIKRSTGHRKDARGLETTLFRDRRISHHSWVTQWPLKPIRLVIVCLSCDDRYGRSTQDRPRLVGSDAHASSSGNGAISHPSSSIPRADDWCD